MKSFSSNCLSFYNSFYVFFPYENSFIFSQTILLIFIVSNLSNDLFLFHTFLALVVENHNEIQVLVFQIIKNFSHLDDQAIYPFLFLFHGVYVHAIKIQEEEAEEAVSYVPNALDLEIN